MVLAGAPCPRGLASPPDENVPPQNERERALKEETDVQSSLFPFLSCKERSSRRPASLRTQARALGERKGGRIRSRSARSESDVRKRERESVFSDATMTKNEARTEKGVGYLSRV